MVGHLFAVPAGADPEHEAAVRDAVHRRDFLGERDRVALDHQTDAGAETDPFRHRRAGAERDERVVRVRVVLRQIATAGERRLAAGRDVRMFREEQRVEAALFDRTGEFDRLNRIVRWKHRDTEMRALVCKCHRKPLRDCSPILRCHRGVQSCNSINGSCPICSTSGPSVTSVSARATASPGTCRCRPRVSSNRSATRIAPTASRSGRHSPTDAYVATDASVSLLTRTTTIGIGCGGCADANAEVDRTRPATAAADRCALHGKYPQYASVDVFRGSPTLLSAADASCLWSSQPVAWESL